MPTRLDCAVSSAALMRQALARAPSREVSHRVPEKLIDQPLMLQVLADMALDVEAATALHLQARLGLRRPRRSGRNRLSPADDSRHEILGVQDRAGVDLRGDGVPGGNACGGGGSRCSIARRRSTPSGRDLATSCVSTCSAPSSGSLNFGAGARQHPSVERGGEQRLKSAVEGVRIMFAEAVRIKHERGPWSSCCTHGRWRVAQAYAPPAGATPSSQPGSMAPSALLRCWPWRRRHRRHRRAERRSWAECICVWNFSTTS